MARKPAKAKKVAQSSEDVPGVTPNPATNLMMADIAMRTGSYLLRNVVERGFLKGRYGKENAQAILDNRTLKQTVATVAVSKIATRSVPGAVIVGSGLIAKTLFDRSQRRRKAKRAGDAKLLDQTRDE